MNKPVPTGQRRLAAFLCADVAGYTRLMGADERGTLRLLTSHREIADREIDVHGGRIANTAGDSVLAEFPSAVDAVQCALAIQDRVARVNDAVPEERRVSFRIGVHVGEAMVRNGDLFGDGVNVASRLEGLAQPGTICLSGAAHEYVHRVLPLNFDDLGLQAMKNVAAPIRAYLLRPSARRPSKSMPLVHTRFEFYLVRRLHFLCMGALSEIARSAGLKGIDIPALASISDEPGIGVRQLAERLGIERTAAERSSSRLERRGLILRIAKADSARFASLSPTPAGTEARVRLRSAVISAQDRLMAPLSELERGTLKDLLARVIEADRSRADD